MTLGVEEYLEQAESGKERLRLVRAVEDELLAIEIKILALLPQSKGKEQVRDAFRSRLQELKQKQKELEKAAIRAAERKNQAE
jgi:hypothetical protein